MIFPKRLKEMSISMYCRQERNKERNQSPASEPKNLLGFLTQSILEVKHLRSTPSLCMTGEKPAPPMSLTHSNYLPFLLPQRGE